MAMPEIGIEEFVTFKFWRAVLAECFGMVIFLLSVSLVAQGWGTPIDAAANHVEIGMGIGLSITTIAVMIGHVSGGHLNPAVSLGLIFAGRISIARGLFYIPAQMAGAIAGSAIAYGLAPADAGLGTVGLHSTITPAQGFGLELMFTFVLVFFVLSITDEKKKVDPYGTVLGIGLCIVVCHLILVPMTGCGINPARAFGPAVIKNKWANHWCYWVGPIVAAPLAAFLYNFIFFEEAKEEAAYIESAIPMKEASNGDAC